MYKNQCLVLDIGSTSASASIARKVRSLGVFCEVLPFDAPEEQMTRRDPAAIIVAGGSGSPFREDAPVLGDYVYRMGVPILGFGMAAGLLLRHAGGTLARSMPGRQTIEVSFGESALFDGLTDSERYVERLDEIDLPTGYRSIARMGEWSVAFEDEAKTCYGLQFYPEQNDPDGLQILSNFVCTICGCPKDFGMARFVEEAPERIRERVGEREVLLGVSGGVDSAVCAALISRAISTRLHCVYVDTGLMRSGDNDAVRYAFEELPGVTLSRIDERERFLRRLEGVSDAQEKRECVERELKNVFVEYAQSLGTEVMLARGTTYDDLLGRPISGARSALGAPFVGLIEPVHNLFKDEVRELGELLELPEAFTQRQAFPDAGLALRCLGEVTSEKLKMLRNADRIFRDEIREAGLTRKIRQYFVVLTDVRTASAEGEPGYTAALRAVNFTGAQSVASAYRLPYDLLERVVERITTEVKGIGRVVYDVTGKPPSAIEWE